MENMTPIPKDTFVNIRIVIDKLGWEFQACHGNIQQFIARHSQLA